jgi:hypothetical protein
MPQLLVLSVLTFLPYWLSRWILQRIGFYQWVWHPALFDTALFVVLLGILNTLLSS